MVTKRSRKVRYGVSRDLDGFPTWTAAFIGSKPAGRRLTFDISVPDKHNFLAEGVTVHNCYKTRMEKHEGAQLIRIRWYGNERPKEGEEVFVERKLHHESWVREQSTKVL